MHNSHIFKLTPHYPKLPHRILIKLEFEPGGWYISHESDRGKCRENGEPLLYKIFDKLGVFYPEEIKDSIQQIWSQFRRGEISVQQTEGLFYELANWIDTGKSPNRKE